MADQMRVVSGPPSGGSVPLSSPLAGGDVDRVTQPLASVAVTNNSTTSPGRVRQLDTGGAFSSGADIATDGNGRAVQATAGDTVVARALEGSSGAGDTAHVVFTGRRVL